MRQYTEIVVRENSELQQQCHQLKQKETTTNQEQSEIADLTNQVKMLEQKVEAFEQMAMCSERCQEQQEISISRQQQTKLEIRSIILQHNAEVKMLVQEKELLI